VLEVALLGRYDLLVVGRDDVMFNVLLHLSYKTYTAGIVRCYAGLARSKRGRDWSTAKYRERQKGDHGKQTTMM